MLALPLTPANLLLPRSAPLVVTAACRKTCPWAVAVFVNPRKEPLAPTHPDLSTTTDLTTPSEAGRFLNGCGAEGPVRPSPFASPPTHFRQPAPPSSGGRSRAVRT